jgi:NAD(P)H-dependent flavin oxidoreductase YrpB (nitropropane dioxygenase family)
MKTALCKKLGIEFPLFAFSHCRDVVAEVTNAGGFGVLGAVGHTPESLKIELDWIDSRVKGRPYGIDLLIPNKMEDKQGDLAEAELQSRIPDGHRKFVNSLLERHGIDTSDLWSGEYDKRTADSMREAGAAKLLDVAFQHPIKLFVNALGVPPKSIMERARSKGILVGALTGAKEHAIKHAEAGVDILVAAGTEAGGHCGEVSTMVLVPEVLQAIEPYENIDVLAAGGIATGRQMADDRRGRDDAHGQAEDAEGDVAQHRPFPEPHGQADATVAVGLVGCLGRQRCAGAPGDAASGTTQSAAYGQGR